MYKEKICPIIIFGRMNGSGKTTIFDAIKLCLYGAEPFARQSEAKYKEYLREKINSSNGTLIKPHYASVQLELEYSSHGELHLYGIERYWQKNGNGIKETLSIQKDGRPIDEVDKEHWQEFIKEMIPVGLSELFFFDGEKIQKIMHDSDNAELKRSIMTLLGLDLIERLQADLKIYRKNLLRKDADSVLTDEITKLENELREKEGQIQRIKYTMESDLAHRIQKTEESIADLESRISAQGGGYLQRRHELTESRITIENELEHTREKIREEASGLLPVSLAKDIAMRLKKQLDKEHEIQREKTTSDTLASRMRRVEEYIKNQSFLRRLKGVTILDESQFGTLLLDAMNAVLLPTPEGGDEPELHSLSTKQVATIVDSIDEAVRWLPDRMKELCSAYETKYRELQKTHADLDKVPDEDLMKPLYQKVADKNRELGGLLSEKKRLEEEESSLLNTKAELVRRKNSLESKLRASETNATKIVMIEKTSKVLTTYYERLSKQKIRKLETEFTNLFLQLHRKDDLIKRIEIDQDTLDIYIYDNYGSRLNLKSLSSGELEIYAIAMI